MDFLAVGFFLTAFFAAVFLVDAFLAAVFFVDVFLVTVFLVGAFLAAVFLGAVFLEDALPRVFPAAALVVDFLPPTFLVATFKLATFFFFLVTAFFADMALALQDRLNKMRDYTYATVQRKCLIGEKRRVYGLGNIAGGGGSQFGVRCSAIIVV